ncbi:HupE/UreJ family protein [Porticoccus sp.]|uniref:HupE/UreJ family protein n=1 Tax=Porticoccus sp. TaxID=2024853 RepID=UPI0025CD2A39|nr:HupE/UreJ family protein [Porticoccus sp.]|tara:strand:+ start:10185 stop:11093 length:909 start_codon:yes stop_codon:yes gene_type:complete
MYKLLLVAVAVLASTLAFGHGMSAEDQARALNASYFEFVELGAIHMITGYDHLLFLFGVMFFLTRFTEIVKFITAFTIGHSITLVFATLAGIKINYFLIDAVIALTVCYKAFDNLDGFKRYLKTQPPSLLWMVFGFGLIHGFGLSTRLQQLPLGAEGLVGKILAFNVGVELGQIAALAIMLVVLSAWRTRKSFTRFSAASNVGLMATGLFLLMFQLHGYMHSKYPDDFPLNKDDHSHVHEDMAELDYPNRPAALKNLLDTGTGKKPNVPTASATTDTNTAIDINPARDKTQHSHDGNSYHSH